MSTSLTRLLAGVGEHTVTRTGVPGGARITTDPGLGRLTVIRLSDGAGVMCAWVLGCSTLAVFSVFSLLISLFHVLALLSNFGGSRVSRDVVR